MLKIAVDAMGGDYAPTSEVEGALQASRDFGVGIILVGRAEEIESELRKHRTHTAWPGSNIQVADAKEVVTMDDPVATAVRRKRNSSIRVAAKLVKNGDAQALVSAGSTGAVMMTAIRKPLDTRAATGCHSPSWSPALLGQFEARVNMIES